MRPFIPAYLLDRLAEADDHTAECVRRALTLDERLRERRQAVPRAPLTSEAEWEVYDADNGTDLPGRLVRSAGQPDTGDAAVDEAAAGLAATLALFDDWGRDSYDGAGATAVATVHYERDYVNAFWDGTQLVFGDGDGEIFDRFTKPIDVLGHELAHALVQHTADLAYEGQSGALNESVADVVGACVRQRVEGQSAAEADWLVGADIFMPGVAGRALRSMLEPGTAYDDPRLGKDPQPAHMDDFVVTQDDNGGVHINSGIPNRAFALAARAIGGESWWGAGRIWLVALMAAESRDDFATFAARTVEHAGEHAALVQEAWAQVGVTPGESSAPQSAPAASSRVAVTRSGGFAAMVREGEVDLDSDDPRAPEVRSLIDRIDFRAAATTTPPQPDRFVYAFRYGPVDVHVPETDLSDELRTLARIVLEQ